MEEVLSTLYKVFKCKSYCSILNKRMTKVWQFSSLLKLLSLDTTGLSKTMETSQYS